MHQLEGKVQADETTRLKRELAGLERENQELRENLRKQQQLSADAALAIGALRPLVEPIYKVTAMIMGEISRVEVESMPSVSGNNNPSQGTSDSVWRERIAKAGTQSGRILQVLLDGGGPMSFSQIKSSARTAGSTSALLSQLMARNWIQKEGHGTYSLKGTL